MGLSVRAYARQRGVSHVAVLRPAKAGPIPLEPDGTIDAATADAGWERSTEPGRQPPDSHVADPPPTGRMMFRADVPGCIALHCRLHDKRISGE
jgi:hypothetical protein